MLTNSYKNKLKQYQFLDVIGVSQSCSDTQQPLLPLPLARDNCLSLPLARDRCLPLPLTRDSCLPLPLARDSCLSLPLVRDGCLPISSAVPNYCQNVYRNFDAEHIFNIVQSSKPQVEIKVTISGENLARPSRKFSTQKFNKNLEYFKRASLPNKIFQNL